MKKLFLLSVLMLLPLFASADAVEINGIYYNLIEKGEVAEVTWNPNNYKGSVVIPESVVYEGRNYSVTSIGYEAFAYCSDLNSVTIPNSVTSIGERAFLKCTSLIAITIPNSVTSIGKQAFGGCSGLTSVTIPNSVTTISEDVFNECRGLTSATIPNSITSIGDRAFWNCSSLTSLTIGNNVTSIGGYAFYGCRSLTSVTIPNSITYIFEYAFGYCSKLTSITIGNNVTSIGSSAFRGCSSLTSVTIPNSVTDIGSYAFEGCSNIKTLSLSEELKMIRESTFEKCRSLKELVIPTKVEFIYANSFSGCNNLESIKSLATTPPWAHDNAFTNFNIPIYVPKEAINAYQATSPWNNFKSINQISDGDTNMKCKKPTISYFKDKLTFNCETDDVEYRSSIKDNDIRDYSTSSIQLSITYEITVYAIKSGYQNSDVATATLCWIDAEPRTEGIANDVVQVRAKAVLIQSSGSMLSIAGTEEGTAISVYDVSGKMVGCATASSETTNISTSLNSGDIGLVKIGSKTIKVIIK